MTAGGASAELGKRIAPTVLVLMGVSGSGKSTVVQELLLRSLPSALVAQNPNRRRPRQQRRA
ncbi:MAG TPA: hypothetical protein VHU15_17040 [Stellaceae bacterium]|jgi:guanylate kinase|nr:hypothetical protein [Stellaceae bacterium]